VPFLTTLSRSRDALGTLTVEILDRRTGQVLAQLGELSAGRYCHASFDAARREYTLYGRLSNGEVQRIDIRYQLAAEDAMFAEN
jgi:hypothetical protein